MDPLVLQPLLEGEICLNPVIPGDAQPLFDLVDRDRRYLREWLPWLDGTRSIQDTLNFIDLSQRQFEKKEALALCIRFQNKITGVVGFNRFDWNNRSTVIGYWLAQDMQGRGIMTRSCRLSLNCAFGRLKLNRVVIHCAIENKKSRAIPERLGFTNEGTLRDGEWLYDKFVDLAVYGLLNREWPGSAKNTD
jgi:ribosomal-protein-serine acetyltransferase